MDWKLLTEEAQLEQIMHESEEKIVLIFKYSTRCATSALAMNRLEREWVPAKMTQVIPYYLDILRYRNISNKIEAQFDVVHESPQVLVIKNGECFHHASHLWIHYSDIEKFNDKISV